MFEVVKYQIAPVSRPTSAYIARWCCMPPSSSEVAHLEFLSGWFVSIDDFSSQTHDTHDCTSSFRSPRLLVVLPVGTGQTG
jgi:hypothetical protein